jgi:hypothetical protein
LQLCLVTRPSLAACLLTSDRCYARSAAQSCNAEWGPGSALCQLRVPRAAESAARRPQAPCCAHAHRHAPVVDPLEALQASQAPACNLASSLSVQRSERSRFVCSAYVKTDAAGGSAAGGSARQGRGARARRGERAVGGGRRGTRGVQGGARSSRPVCAARSGARSSRSCASSSRSACNAAKLGAHAGVRGGGALWCVVVARAGGGRRHVLRRLRWRPRMAC